MDETLLVVDAMAGQDAVNVAKTFNEKIGITGVILTKTDGDTRGGAALSRAGCHRQAHLLSGHRRKAGRPGAFLSGPYGQPHPGHGRCALPDRKGAEHPDDKEAEDAAKRLMENKFDMNDLLAQFQQMKKMGGASALLAMMPGGNQIDADALDEKMLPHIEAIIYSHDPRRARQAFHHQPQAQAPHRGRLRPDGRGCQQAAAASTSMMQKMMKKVKRNPKGFMRGLGNLGGMGGFKGFGR